MCGSIPLPATNFLVIYTLWIYIYRRYQKVTFNIQNESIKYMTLVIELAVAVVVGFVIGVLVGRRNASKVEVGVAEAKAILKKAGIDA